jgi:hypothetical protein
MWQATQWNLASTLTVSRSPTTNPVPGSSRAATGISSSAAQVPRPSRSTPRPSSSVAHEEGLSAFTTYNIHSGTLGTL